MPRADFLLGARERVALLRPAAVLLPLLAAVGPRATDPSPASAARSTSGEGSEFLSLFHLFPFTSVSCMLSAESTLTVKFAGA